MAMFIQVWLQKIISLVAVYQNAWNSELKAVLSKDFAKCRKHKVEVL